MKINLKYILRLIAILLGLTGAILYFFTEYSNIAFYLFAIGGIILFFDIKRENIK